MSRSETPFKIPDPPMLTCEFCKRQSNVVRRLGHAVVSDVVTTDLQKIIGGMVVERPADCDETTYHCIFCGHEMKVFD